MGRIWLAAVIGVFLAELFEGGLGGAGFGGFASRGLAVGAAGGPAAGVEIEQAEDVAGVPTVRLPVLERETPEGKVNGLGLDECALGGVGTEAGEPAVEGDGGRAGIGGWICDVT